MEAHKEGDGSPSPQNADVTIPPSWSEAAEVIRSAISPPGLVVAICGPKNSGKSTFSRFLLNTLLRRYKRVAYLDTDVGQPEFSPPGCISLHIVDDLIKGTGYDILVEMLRYVSPNVVVQLRISLHRKNLPTGAFWLDGGKPAGPLELIDLESHQQDLLAPSVLAKKDARCFRGLLISEYFRQCFKSDISLSTNKELAFALASIPPYQVSFSRVKVKHLHHQVPIDEIWHSLNATIVGLAVSSVGPARANSYPWCIGLGIVRGIDVSRGLLYVITPVPVQSLQKVDILLQGLIEIPTSLLQVRGCISPYMCTNVVPTISHKNVEVHQ
ncbi:pre-mRNA cleavage complex II protein family isoform X2 [Carex rostrata]